MLITLPGNSKSNKNDFKMKKLSKTTKTVLEPMMPSTVSSPHLYMMSGVISSVYSS